MTEPTLPSPGDTPTTEPAARPPKRRRWRIVLLAGVALLASLVGSLAWLTGSEAGFARLWQLAARASGGALSVARVEGTLWRGFTLEDARWQQPLQRFEVSRLMLAWQPRALWQGELKVDRLSVGSVLVDDRTPASGKPTAAPTSLALPLDVEVARLSVDAVVLAGPKLTFQQIAGSYRYQSGFHTVALERFVAPWGEAAGALALGGAAPFALSGRVDLKGELEGHSVRAQTDVGGTLVAPTLKANAVSAGVLIDVDGRFAPFAPVLFRKVDALTVRMAGVDPARLMPGAPAARISLAIEAKPEGDGLQGGLSLINTAAGAVSAGKLPLKLAVAAFRVDDDRLVLSDAFADLGSGRLTFAGDFNPRTFDLRVGVDQLALKGIEPAAPALTVSGNARLAGPKLAPTLSLALAAGGNRLTGEALWQRSGAAALDIRTLALVAGAGSVSLGGRLGLTGELPLALKGSLAAFDPARVSPSLPAGRIDGKLDVDARLADGSAGRFAFSLAPSTLSGAPLSGYACARWQGVEVDGVDVRLALGGNRLSATGAWGEPGDRLSLTLAADQLELLGPAFGGRANAALQLAGTPRAPLFTLRADAADLRLPGEVSVASLAARGELASGAGTPFELALKVAGARAGDARVETLTLAAAGTRGRHTLALTGKLSLAERPYAVQANLAGGLSDAYLWQGTLSRLQLDGAPSLVLLQPVLLTAGADEVRLGGGRWQALGADWRLDNSGWRRSDGWYSAGSVRGLGADAVQPFVDKLPVATDLSIGGEWSLRGQGALPQGSVRFVRESGDVTLPLKGGGTRPLGLSALEAALRLDGGSAALNARLQSALGSASGDANLRALGGAFGAASPLSGRVALALPDLSLAQPWLAIGQRVAGKLDATLNLAGTLGEPQLSGPLRAANLAFTDRLAGVALQDGTLDAVFAGRTLTLQRLSFGRDDSVSASGSVSLAGARPTADIAVRFNRFVALSRPGMRVVVSGQTTLALGEDAVSVDGMLKVDRARLDFPKLGAPALGPDVVVVGRPKREDGETTLPFALNVGVDLGDKVRFSGKGLTTGLTGQLRLIAKPGAPLSVFGVVDTEEGRFKAYGQDLDIDKGQIVFNGPPDNPGLAIRALRRNSPVGAGVEVTGSVLYPKVALISDEPMPEKERFSWLVLGRGTGGGSQDNAALAASAGSFLAGALNDQIGLFDDIGLTSTEEKTLSNGTVSPAEQVVTLGRQLTQSLYLGYEYGITSASQAVKVVYRLSKGWSVQAKAGTTVDVETRYTVRFD
ncbi:translocation/assembly module TamB domain-containing protein [Crenobacter caeni]|uniref:Translocation/assembly module TamB n=1 Tax=Crenobacter caeni TaxID=2705474 RepID=A0A6B2KU51_9NEIS|nr:translocation/assembly module TamB domain-containing protein [Crenobacter caeni]NDV13634.1 translocation/assembly module TamB [Crenobacter caeni]